MTNKVLKLASIASICILAGCASTVDVNKNAPAPDTKPNLIDTELQSLTTELIDAHNRLVSTRQLKEQSLVTKNEAQSKLMQTKFSGLDVVRDFDCQCDLKTAMQALAINLNWDMDKVLELGRKPAQGVPVTIKQKNKPLSLVLESVDRQVGHFVDIRVDPNYETILIQYVALDAPRGGLNAQ
ncbi:DotD/TraH family lipoprotein [Vibrio harveyi]|uniref:DotD/TraH family lipoprotein n=1 Tax=Vibrio harveyi TaxID=669 RepID=UPI00247FE8FD|nr:DotD/TraH family lipoprotein [Vibrio harveyi]